MSVWEKITMVGVGREVKRGKKKRNRRENLRLYSQYIGSHNSNKP